MRIGNKKIFHLEAWVVKVMSLYKVWTTFARQRSELADHYPKHFFYGINFDDFD